MLPPCVEASVTESDPLVGTILAGRYRVIAPIGRGGAGTVYRGIQLQLEREVAIKVVRPDVSEGAREELEARFFREAALAGRLSHPHLVKMFDYGSTEDGRQFVVMELLRGRSLKRALDGTQLDPADVARIGAQLARGLHHAHSEGLVHRDVKASNVFLVRDEEGNEHARLLDFGLVKSLRQELDVTQTPTYLGTPLYMSPEQARGERDLDGRSDLYSLGCLLYRMACGEMPFRGETPLATALLHVNAPYPPMKVRSPDVRVDPRLERIVRRCMAKRPEDRWADGAALAQALDAFGDLASRPPPPPKRSGPVVWLGIAGAVGLGGLLVGGVAVVGGVAAVLWSAGVFQPPPQHAPVAVSDEVARATTLEPPLDAAPLADAPAGPRLPDPPADPPPTVERSPEPALSDPPVAEPPPRVAPTVDTTPAKAAAPPAVGPVVDGYTFASPAHAARALEFANTATWSELRKSGVAYKIVPRLADGRPYDSIDSLGETKGIGPATLRALGEHTK